MQLYSKQHGQLNDGLTMGVKGEAGSQVSGFGKCRQGKENKFWEGTDWVRFQTLGVSCWSSLADRHLWKARTDQSRAAALNLRAITRKIKDSITVVQGGGIWGEKKGAEGNLHIQGREEMVLKGTKKIQQESEKEKQEAAGEKP